jgi:8-oxo-dGTP diphosphatase
MTRTYPERPIVGVGAVVLRDGAVLLVRRAQEPCKGEWTFPGGMVELGETTRHAAERETLEETGIRVRAGEVLEVVDSIVRDAEGRAQYHYSLIDFLCEAVSGELTPSGDVDAVRWVPIAEALRMPLAGVTGDVLRKALQRPSPALRSR